MSQIEPNADYPDGATFYGNVLLTIDISDPTKPVVTKNIDLPGTDKSGDGGDGGSCFISASQGFRSANGENHIFVLVLLAGLAFAVNSSGRKKSD